MDTRPEQVEITHSVGGTHWRTLVVDGNWYQGFGSSLLALSVENGAKLDDLKCMPLGKSGALVDLVVYQGDLIGVLDRTAVVRIDRTNPKSLIVTETMDQKQLGIRPESLSIASGGLFVSGLGGVVRLDTGERFLESGQVCGRVVDTAQGLVATRAKTIVRLSDGEAVGRATDLQSLPAGTGPVGGIAFVLQGAQKARVGILSDDLVEIQGEVVQGEVNRVRVVGGQLWAITSRTLFGWKITQSGLTDPIEVAVRGALDLDMIDANTLVVSGTFGRAMYRIKTDAHGPGDEFYNATREAGRLERVLSDGRRIIAGSDEGTWLYMAGGSCEPSANKIQNVNPPNSTADFSFGTAVIEGADADPYTVESSARVVVTAKGRQQTIQMPQGAHARTLANVRDDLWIGHDDGIDVWKFNGASMERISRVRIQGPVINIYPRRTNDGASYVSIFGGMGVAMWRKIDAPVSTVSK